METPFDNEILASHNIFLKPMKTFCNFSNQEALLSDDYSPYIDQCDINSLYGDTTLSKLPSKDEKSHEIMNPLVCERKTAPNVTVGLTPTLFTKLRKPIEKAESLTTPSKTMKRKGVKKVKIILANLMYLYARGKRFIIHRAP